MRLTASGYSDTIGFLPYRHPITSVGAFTDHFLAYESEKAVCLVGRPIRVEQSDKPSLEQMQDVQKRYIAELTRCALASELQSIRRLVADSGTIIRIWDTHKDEYASNRRRELSIVD